MTTTTLTIEKLVYGGDGLARLPMDDGRRQAVFVPFTLPGEVVEAELEPARRGRATARLLRVLQPSPDRVAPHCEYFGRCGGCQLQHVDPDAQLRLKREILLETLRRTGGVVWEGAVALHASPPWAYRNRVRLQVLPGRGLGYHERASHRILAVTHCPLASPLLNREIARLGRAAAAGRAREIELAADNDDHHLLESAGELRYRVGAHTYIVGPGAFFQVNRFLTPELVAAVAGEAGGGRALDLFSGVGLFTLPLAERFTQVTAVESDRAAVRDLRRNTAGHDRIQVAALPALAYMTAAAAAPETLDLVVADPPRAGLGRELTAALLRARPRRLHLVACDPATLGRDLGDLLQGGYRIDAIALFDLFPQTFHLETVVKLTPA